MRALSLLLWSSILLPALVAGAIIWGSYDSTMREAHTRALHTARVLREHALRVFESQRMAMSWIDTRISGMAWDEIARSRAVHDVLRTINDQSPHIDGMWLIRPDGRVAGSADFFPVPPSDVGEREYFQAVRARDVPHLGRMIQGRLKGTFSFNLAGRRGSPDGAFDGVILVTSSLGYFEDFWAGVLPDEPHSVGLIRADGEILARYPGVTALPPRLPAGSPFFSDISRSDAGSYEHSSATDGVRRIFAFAKLGDYPAYVVLGLDRAEVLAPWWRRAVVVGGLAAALSALLATAVVVARRQERRLSEEVRRRQRAETTLIAKEEHLAALERAEGALRQSETRFRSLFETLTQGVVVCDAAGVVLTANAAAGAILGAPPDVLAGSAVTDPAWAWVDGEGRPLAAAGHPALIALRTGGVVQGVSLGCHNGVRGERRWLVMDAIPQRRPEVAAPTGVFLLIVDVTERRHAEEAQQLLIREVDHRAKNALAVVQAVIRLTEAPTKDGFLEAVEGRIGALARTHTLLARSRWEGAGLHHLVEEELAAYRTGGRVLADGPPLSLAATAAQTVGMVLHELATNAAKHGSLSVPGGTVAITWSRAAADEVLALSWTESGGPPVAAPTRRGFGSRLVRANIESQLRGRAAFDWRAEGLRVTIHLPAEHVRGVPAPAPDEPAAAVPDGAPSMRGQRVLVVEDNALLAMALADALTRAGCAVVGPVGTVEAALHLLGTGVPTVACLDVDLQGQLVFPVAEALRARGVPFVFCTGFGDVGPAGGVWANVPLLRKPVNPAELALALSRVGRRSDQRVADGT